MNKIMRMMLGLALVAGTVGVASSEVPKSDPGPTGGKARPAPPTKEQTPRKKQTPPKEQAPSKGQAPKKAPAVPDDVYGKGQAPKTRQLVKQ